MTIKQFDAFTLDLETVSFAKAVLSSSFTLSRPSCSRSSLEERAQPSVVEDIQKELWTDDTFVDSTRGSTPASGKSATY